MAVQRREHFGATNSTLTLSDVQLADAGNYAVDVTNSADSITSAVATLTVVVPLLTSPAHVPGGQFQFTVMGESGVAYVIQVSSDLADWISIYTNTSPFTFIDPNANNFPQGYYRALPLP